MAFFLSGIRALSGGAASLALSMKRLGARASRCEGPKGDHNAGFGSSKQQAAAHKVSRATCDTAENWRSKYLLSGSRALTQIR